jgi:hypothetical protein
MEVERLDRKRIATFGECIYCGRKAGDTKLTDEHAVPLSLGGNVILENASCTECAKITGQLEAHLARYVFWQFRNHNNTRSRRKGKRPSTLPAKIQIGERTFWQEISVKDHPFYTPFPVWPTPGVLTGAQPTSEFEWIKADIFSWMPPNIRETLELAPAEQATVHYPDIQFDSFRFARAIMKMAYCTAVMRFGLHGFRRLFAPAVILGRYPFIPYLVGTFHEALQPPTDKSIVHAIGVHLEQVGRMTLVGANVRLFSNSGTVENGPPTYRVVIGAPPIDWTTRTEWAA